MRRIPLSSETYESDVRPLSAQRLMNVYPEIGPRDGKSPYMLQGAPGLELFLTVGDGPIRGIHRSGTRAFVVSGTGVFEIFSDGTSSLLGEIGGSGQVSMASNKTQTCIVESTGPGWVISGTSLNPITNAGYQGASSVAYLDGYGVFSQIDSGRFFISSLNDFSTFDATDVATAESAPDDTTRVIVDHRQLWLYGESSVEVWWNSGAADFPFARFNNLALEDGALSPRSIAKIDNSQFYLGRDFILYRIDQYRPVRVSNHAMESAIAGYGDPENCYAFTYSLKGHKTYVITWPGWGTWCYDISTGSIYERRSYGKADWRAFTSSTETSDNPVYIFDKVLVGDNENGNVYELSLDVHTENGAIIERIITTPNFHNNGDNLYCRRLQLDAMTGPHSVQSPQIMMQYSADEGFTFSNEIWRGFGDPGEYKKRVIWDTPILERNLLFRWTLTDAVPFGAITAYADMEGGET